MSERFSARSVSEDRLTGWEEGQENGGRDKSRTCDLYDVNVAL